MNFIDLFAGAGGLSEGFIRQGFTPIAHVEMDKYAALTLKTRTAYHRLKEVGRLEIYEQYIRGEITREQLFDEIPNLDRQVIQAEISDDSLPDIFGMIENNMLEMGINDVDLLIGGPPCQAYSLVGRARDPYGKEHDHRNYLYKQYVEFLRKFQPKMFLFENVPGIMSAGKGELFADVQRYMDEAGYEIQAKVLDAHDYGVLQKRKRVILIGWKKGTDYYYPALVKHTHTYQVGDLLSDLPALEPGQSILCGEYFSEPTAYLKNTNIREEEDILTQHITRPHNGRDREIYRLTIELWEKERKRIKYTELPDDLKTHKNQKVFLDRFKVVSADEPYSHTVVAHIAKDGHYYIHPDRKQLRSLSVREAARLQSFPDNYFFEGPRTAIFTQIGNAVPPLLSETIAFEVMKLLGEPIYR